MTYSMLLFRSFFYFSCQICLIFGMWTTNKLHNIVQFFSSWFFRHFWEITNAKNNNNSMSSAESCSKKWIPKFTPISQFYADFSLHVMLTHPAQEKKSQSSYPQNRISLEALLVLCCWLIAFARLAQFLLANKNSLRAGQSCISSAQPHIADLSATVTKHVGKFYDKNEMELPARKL